MADTLVYDVLLPAAGVDVESRELTVTINGTAQPVLTPDKFATTTRISVPQDSTIHLSLVDIDDAGNRSEPSTYDFVALDTLPPATPGALGVTLVGEEETPEVKYSPT